MNRSRPLAAVLTIGLFITVTACGSTPETATAATSNASPTATAAPEPSATAVPAPTATPTAAPTPTPDPSPLPTATSTPRQTPERIPVSEPTRFEIGGRDVFLQCAGEGSPTVVVEAGLSDVGLSWNPVQQLIAVDTQICWVSRAGLGLTDVDPEIEIRTAQDAVDDLVAVLAAASVEPPYVMAGNSFGGFVVRLFTDQHRDDVVGMVLVDSSHHDQQAVLRARLAETLGREVELLPPPGNEPIDVVRSARQVAAVKPLGDLPLTVLTQDYEPRPIPLPGVSPDEARELVPVFNAVWLELQQDLAANSTVGEQITVAGAGHLIQVDDPDAVADAIRDLLPAE